MVEKTLKDCLEQGDVFCRRFRGESCASDEPEKRLFVYTILGIEYSGEGKKGSDIYLVVKFDRWLNPVKRELTDYVLGDLVVDK